MFPHCFLGGSVPASDSSSSSVAVPLSSGGCLGLDKFKTLEGSWDCDVCLVQNKADATECVVCESAKPGANSAFKGKALVKYLFVLPFLSEMFANSFSFQIIHSLLKLHVQWRYLLDF